MGQRNQFLVLANPMISFNSGRRAGLECGATGAKMILLTRRDSGFQVEQIFLEEELFESRIKGKTRRPLELARQLLIHKNLSGYKIVCVAGDASENCFVILPKMDKTEADSALLLQAKKLIQWENEKPIVSFIESDFLRDRQGYLVGLADWRAVKAWCRLIEAGGGLIDNITLGACAYQALARHQGWADEFPVFLVADLGATTSSFYVLDRHTVRFMRKVPVGGDAITKMLTTTVSTDAEPIQLTDNEAEEVKIIGYLPLTGKKEPARRSGPMAPTGGGEPPAEQPAPKRLEQMEVLVRPVIERITSEIMRSIQFFKDNAGQPVAAVLLTGGTAGLQLLQTHLAISAGLPVRMIEPFSGLTFANPGVRNYAEKHQTRLAMAMGLALADQPSISLLPRPMQLLKQFAVFMPRLVAALLILGFIPLLVSGIYRVVKTQAVRSEIRKLEQQVQQAVQERQQFEGLQTRLQATSESFRALRHMVGHNPLWPGILNALADALPRDIVLTRFSSGFDAQQPAVIVLEGKVLPTAQGFDDAMAALLPALGATVFFKQVNIINAKAHRTESMLGTFEIQGELVY